MPDEEYNGQHRFTPYYVIGQMDHSKEVLIPKTQDG
jgi:cytochrome oxidase assembly protein ShyY1